MDLMPVTFEPRLANQMLGNLASRWFLLNKSTKVNDVNELLLAPYPSADTLLSSLAPPRGVPFFEFNCNDPIVVAALDERVRRACAMALEDAVYADYLSRKYEQALLIGSEEALPSGAALPAVNVADRDKFLKDL
jgi:hypothetical protein